VKPPQTDHRRRHTIVAIGEVLWDMLPGGPQLGGAPANVAFHARALGADAALISCVGRDELGSEIIARLSRAGVGTGALAIDPVRPTGTVAVVIGHGGEPHYTITEEVAWDYIPASSEAFALARSADALCYGTLAQRAAGSRATIRACVEAARVECLRVFDVNLRDPFVDRVCVEETLARSHVLKLNEAELHRIADWFNLRGSETAILETLMARYPLRLVALTRGERGSRLYGGVGDSTHPGIRARVVDTVGAGDAFTAAVIRGLLDGQPLDDINAEANRVASRVCSHAGAAPTFEARPV